MSIAPDEQEVNNWLNQIENIPGINNNHPNEDFFVLEQISWDFPSWFCSQREEDFF